METRIADDEQLAEVLELLASRGWGDEFDSDLGDLCVAFDDGVIACLQVVEIGEEPRCSMWCCRRKGGGEEVLVPR